MREYRPFSVREGYVNPEEILKQNFKGMTKELRIELWNEIYRLFKEYHSSLPDYVGFEQTFYEEFVFRIWGEALGEDVQRLENWSIDSVFGNISLKQVLFIFREKYERLEWFRIYDMLEYITQILPRSLRITRVSFKLFDAWLSNINSILKRRLSPYRLMKDGIIIPITNEMEIKTIEEALDVTDGKFSSVYKHLKKSLQHFSDRENPDYENAVKEAISALESFANLILRKKGKTLTELRQKLSSELNLPRFVELQIKELYNWASQTPVRHGTGEEPTIVDQEEARLVVVEISALVNYLISKAVVKTGGLK